MDGENEPMAESGEMAIDPTMLSFALTGLNGFRALATALRERVDCRLILIVDSRGCMVARADMLVADVPTSLTDALADCEAGARRRVVDVLRALVSEVEAHE